MPPTPMPGADAHRRRQHADTAFRTPKDAGDAVFAVIAPIELTADQAVTITAICEAGESEPRDIAGKHFSEGHTTPIAYHIPAIAAITRV